jgi:C4-dicarboxylate-specific signal transduction histidine kinase
LIQVIYSILLNSIDALIYHEVKYPTINLSLVANTKNVTITICDNGGGIEDGILNKIFDPYFSTKPYGDKYGMGLFYAKVFIEKSFGGIIKAENYDSGARFIVEFACNND